MLARMDCHTPQAPVRVLFAACLCLGACTAAPPTQPVNLVFATRGTPDLSQGAAAAVRLRVEDGQTSYVRSGVLIDPRGYVLTSFSSVGVESLGEARRGGAARPGTLYDSERVQVEIFEGPYTATPQTYIARVVRGDIRLNLALLRITETLDGVLVGDEQRFPFIDLASIASEPRWGSSGLAIGAGANLPSLMVRPGTLIAGIRNSRDQIAGYLVDLSMITLDGAPYFDGEGRFAGLLSRGFLRPPERIPEAWRNELAAGAIDTLEVQGIEVLEPGVWSDIDLIGDSPFRQSFDDDREVTEDFFYRLPNLRAGTIVAEPAVLITVYQGGRRIAGGSGEVFIAAEADVLVAVSMPRPNNPRGLRLRVRFEPLQ